MAELNGSKKPVSHNHHKKGEENEKKLPTVPAVDNSIDSSGNLIPKNTTDSKPIPKVVDHLDSERKSFLPLLRMDLLHSINSNTNPPQHFTRTYSKEAESPSSIVEASDLFLDPAIYKKYSISVDLEDTFQERLAKKMETIKDVTRDRAVNSITAGENAVYRLVRTLKFLTSGWFGLVIILFTVLVYGAFGALIFMALESPSEEMYNIRIVDIRRVLAIKIENIARNETIMMAKPDFLTLIQDDLIAYENQYSEYIKHVHNNDVTQSTWNFWNSYIFAGTIFTTIGYGHICPKTTLGRAATIVYAIIGIPLFLILLASFGRFLTRIIKYFWAYIFCSRSRINAGRTPPVQEVKTNTDGVYRPSLIEDQPEEITPQIQRKDEAIPDITTTAEIEVNEEFDLPIYVALSILILYMICGAVVVHFLEPWSYFDAFYCVFISMSTIGLGDLVVNDSMNMIYSILYTIFGLSLTAMCIEVVQRKLTVMFENTCKKVLELVDESDDNLESSASG